MCDVIHTWKKVHLGGQAASCLNPYHRLGGGMPDAVKQIVIPEKSGSEIY
jgi:hypothetical protein